MTAAHLTDAAPVLVAGYLAALIRRRFDHHLGQPLVVSTVVERAARDILEVFLGPNQDVFGALDEFEMLERSL